jgi:hypothetical protein
MLLATIALVSLGVLLAGAAGAVLARRHVRQDPRPAHAFFALGTAVLPVCAVMALATGRPLAAAPTAVVAGLCFAAGWTFHPTAGSRFADFERAFRAYADQHARRSA